MSDINQNKCSDNDVNGAGASSEGASSGRCPVGEQHRPGRQHATARVKWSKEVNKVVIECYLRSRPVNENGVPIRGYRQRMFRVWQEIGLFEATEQRICDQARAIRKNGWLSELEIEMIKRKISQENAEDVGDSNTDERMESDGNTPEGTELSTRNDPGDDINIEERNDVSEEDRRMIADILEIFKLGGNHPVNFKKANQRQLKEMTEKVNTVLYKIPTRNITENNKLVNAVSIYIDKEIGLKQNGESLYSLKRSTTLGEKRSQQ